MAGLPAQGLGAGPAPGAPPAAASGALDPRAFGAVGDGRSRPIGTRFGRGLDAMAAWRDPAGRRPNSWMADPRYGLRFTLAASAAQQAPGRTATFLTTMAGIFGTQDFAQFNGDPAQGQKRLSPGWLVSGAGIAPDTTVERFDVSAGTVSFSRATTTALQTGAVLTFTMPPAVLEASELDWLGTQAAMASAVEAGGGVVALAPGDYVWNQSVWSPGVGDGSTFRGAAALVGADQASTRIRFTAELGEGGCALGEANRGPGSVGFAHFRGFRLLGPGRPRNDGGPVAAMDGLCVGQAARVEHLQVQLFRAGINMVKDHGQVAGVDVSNNGYGFYFGPNGDSMGNWSLRDSGANANGLAGLAVAWNNQVDFSLFRNLDLGGGSPYAMLKEQPPSGRSARAGFLSNSVLEHVFSEQVGMGWIRGDGRTDQVDNNVFIHCTAWMSGERYKIPGHRAQAVVQAGRVTRNTFVASDLGNGGANAPAVSEAIVLASDTIQSNDWGVLGPVLPAKPFLAAPTVLMNTFRTDRATGAFLRAEAPFRAGQVVAYGATRLAAGVRAMAPNRIARGVAAHQAAEGQVVAVLLQGLAEVLKTPDRPLALGEPVAPSTVAPGAVTAASAGLGPAVGVWAGENDAAAAATSGFMLLGALPR